MSLLSMRQKAKKFHRDTVLRSMNDDERASPPHLDHGINGNSIKSEKDTVALVRNVFFQESNDCKARSRSYHVYARGGGGTQR